MKRFLFAVLLFLTLQLNAQPSLDTLFDKKYTSDQLLEDFDILKRGLETIHPGLYRYTDKKEMDSIFNHIGNHLKMELT
ncbi:MAG: hypothetical protein AAGA02_13130, partial [Bacteroidota bacterium]